MGEDTTENRSSDTVKMLNYGFNSFKLNTFKTKDEVLGKVRVEKGKTEFVEIVLLNDATELLKINEENPKYTFNVKVNKIVAPVKNGDIVGTAEIIDNEGNIIDEVDLTVKEDVEKANLWDYWQRNIRTIAFGKTTIKQ